MKFNTLLIASTIATMGLTACSSNDDTKATTAENTSTTTTVETKPEPTTTTSTTPAPAPASTAALASKVVGDHNFQITKAVVVGKILTVELAFSPNKSGANFSGLTLRADEISYIDDATSKKMGLLKDDQGMYMANPMDANGTNMANVLLKLNNTSGVASFKFAAPAEETKTISLNLPKLGSFDGLPISR